MNKAKSVSFIGMCALVAFMGQALAQEMMVRGQPPSPPTASEITSRMKQELNLTDEQVSQVTPVIEVEISQMKIMMSQGTDREAGRSQMEELRKSTEAKLTLYLSSEQLAKWKSKMSQPPEGKVNGRGPKSMGEPGRSHNAEQGSSSVSRSSSGSGIW